MLAAGSTIAGRYRLASLIGEGGMASVWRAEDQTLKRSVAIKLLYFGAHRDPAAMVEHFLREARIAASIQHRNVIHIVDFGSTDQGVPYMVMEFLHGESLGARLEREPKLTMEEIVRLASLTLRGLSAVHDAGIVHRDLKPQNIFLQQDGDAAYPKILDFGISRSLAASGERPSAIVTQQGLVVGTPHYMAPEQARGEGSIDKRADIYAMGVIIYEAITGQVPFDAPTPGELLVKIISSTAPSMRELRPDVPAVLSDCIAQAMAPNRDHRFIDAHVFSRALQGAAHSAFPQRAVGRSSELPTGAIAAARSAPKPTPDRSTLGAEEAHAPGWGDFEGLTTGSGRPNNPRASGVRSSSPARVPSGPLVAAPPAVAAAPAGRGSQARVKAVAAPPSGATAHDGAMLGDSPLDAFGAAGAVALDLDVDYGSTGDAGRRSRHSPAPRPGKRNSSADRVGYVDRHPTRKPRRGPSALWIVPALLLLCLFVLLLAPGMFSAPAPDSAAGVEREAQRPATQHSDRQLTPARPVDLAKMPAALRELPD